MAPRYLTKKLPALIPFIRSGSNFLVVSHTARPTIGENLSSVRSKLRLRRLAGQIFLPLLTVTWLSSTRTSSKGKSGRRDSQAVTVLHQRDVTEKRDLPTGVHRASHRKPLLASQRVGPDLPAAPGSISAER